MKNDEINKTSTSSGESDDDLPVDTLEHDAPQESDDRLDT